MDCSHWRCHGDFKRGGYCGGGGGTCNLPIRKSLHCSRNFPRHFSIAVGRRIAATQCGGSAGSLMGGEVRGPHVYQKRGGGEGVWDPKVCVPKMAQINISSCKCHVFPIRVRGGLKGQVWPRHLAPAGPGRGGYPPPSSGGCQPFSYIPGAT